MVVVYSIRMSLGQVFRGVTIASVVATVANTTTTAERNRH
jgi:hypothetical protein